ncbi:GNAT family N-acetyltransferase [Gillisia sp. CAL575]|uniref:GNAT family N-acetyltransferase n=1 Tax=Gillisia sp. CAL575 TaxID=985255 RepID=UPI00039E2192|nr:GNAT family N-acetyltransferase [Gillisia sp. CAL575]
MSLLYDIYRVFYRQTSDLIGAINFIRDRLSFKDSKIFAAADENKLLGFVQLDPLFSSTRLKRARLLNDLFVSPEARGQHLRVRLIERAQVFAAPTNSVGLC